MFVTARRLRYHRAQVVAAHFTGEEIL